MLTQAMISVILVEDYKLLRMGLEANLREVGYFNLVASVGTAEEALDIMATHPCDVLLLDLGLPGLSGTEALPQFKALNPALKVIILTSQDEQHAVVDAFKAGANAYCLKDIEAEQLNQVLLKVHQGGTWLDPAVAGFAVQAMTQATAHPAEPVALLLLQPPVAPQPKAEALAIEPSHAPALTLDLTEFTPKEREALPLLAAGQSNSEVAQALGISVHTAKVHVSHILNKLNVYDRVQAALTLTKAGVNLAP